MKIKAYVCCDEWNCEAMALATVCVDFEDNKPVLGVEFNALPDGWEHHAACAGYSRYDSSPETNYCPVHRRRGQ